jgi:hypothetical protein
MAKDQPKTELVKPTSQLDLERRLDKDNESEVANRVPVTRNPDHFGREAYVGVDPIYQNHANDTEKPYAAEEGPEKDAEEFFKESSTSHLGTPKAAELKGTSDEQTAKAREAEAIERAKKEYEDRDAANKTAKEELDRVAQGPFADTVPDEKKSSSSSDEK